MSLRPPLMPGVLIGALVLLSGRAWPLTFKVVTYNVEGYLEVASPTRAAKSPQSKAKVHDILMALAPDVLALQEMGGTNALSELRQSLKQEGLELPYWELVTGADTNINLAVLSRFPIVARRPHTDQSFLLSGRRFHVSRGIAEVDVQVTTNYSFTLIAAHLKSRRLIPQADEAEMRLEEAKILRQIIERRFAADPEANLIVLGDFNDTREAASTKTIIGHGKMKLVDTRPAERNGDESLGPDPEGAQRKITWTHFYAKDDVYSRIDFILVSPAMAGKWIRHQTYLPTIGGWGLASDHRPVLATFDSGDE